MTKTSKPTVTLIRRGKHAYCATDADYEILREAGVPILVIDEEFAPMLTHLQKIYNLTFSVIEFDAIEQAMFEKVQARWKHEISLTKSEITLKTPRKKSAKLELDKLVEALRKWYRKHKYKLELSERKGAKSYKVLLYKQDDLF